MTETDLSFYGFFCDWVERNIFHPELAEDDDMPFKLTSPEARQLATAFTDSMAREGFKLRKTHG